MLTGNELGMLGNSEHFPSAEEGRATDIGDASEELKERFKNDDESFEYHKHLLVKDFLESHQLMKTWKVLLS